MKFLSSFNNWILSVILASLLVVIKGYKQNRLYPLPRGERGDAELLAVSEHVAGYSSADVRGCGTGDDGDADGVGADGADRGSEPDAAGGVLGGGDPARQHGAAVDF